MDNSHEMRGIQEVADSLGITTRTLRFYEDKGLIDPHRVGNSRIYTKRDTARMQLVLRGKRLGFSLKEIQEFLDLYDADPGHIEQMRVLAERCGARIAELKAQREALDLTLDELNAMQREAFARIEQLS
jgi:DNA-binding transcriptional MerR regulator